MNKKRYFKYTFIIIGFALIGFLTGFLIRIASFSKTPTIKKTTVNKISNIYDKTISTTPIISPDPIINHYILINENEVLTLYEINGNKKTEIKSININSCILPNEDQKKLLNGIQINTLEEGFNLMADFSS